MKEYIFVFGRDPGLSYLELKAYLDSHSVKHEVKLRTENGVVVKASINCAKVVKDLAGTPKVAEVVDLEREELYSGTKNKVVYGVDAYGADDDEVRAYLKKRLKSEKLKGMLKQPKGENLSPTESIRLLKEGFEVVVFGKFIGIVRAVYNPEAYKRRDSGKPVQRPRPAP